MSRFCRPLVGRLQLVDSQESTNKYSLQNLSIFLKNLQITYFKTRRVTRCLQYLQHANHVCRANGQELAWHISSLLSHRCQRSVARKCAEKDKSALYDTQSLQLELELIRITISETLQLQLEIRRSALSANAFFLHFCDAEAMMITKLIKL